MNEDWRDPKVLCGLILAIILLIITIVLVVAERF
jgi:tetrahydromethanopterin S-methyltransferase subunit G